MKKVVTPFRLFLCRLISTGCQTNFQLVKVAAYEENGLQILHGCIETMMEHVIVQVVSGPLKAINFQENIKKEFKTVNGLK